MRRIRAREFRHGIGLGRLSLILLFAVTAATWLASPPYGSAAGVGKTAPKISGTNWLNSKPLTTADLKGRVVLVEFWTYG